MKIKENIAVSESGFLFDPNTGDSFSVNSSGKEILQLLTSGKTNEEIVQTIIESYDADANTLNRYLDDFAHSLRRYNLIEADDE